MPEVQITTLIEMLMRQAIRLDCLAAEGDALAQKHLQVHSSMPFVYDLGINFHARML